MGLFGLLLALVGFFLWAIRGRLDPWSLTPLALGILLILAYLFSNFNELVVKMSGRTAREGVNSAVMILITLGIICFLQVIFTRHSKRIDTTQSGKYSLAPQTIQLLQKLGEPVTITFLWNPQLPSERQSAEDLFKEFHHYSDKVSYSFVDPVKNPTEVDRFKVGDTVTLNSGYVECGTKREKVSGVEEGDYANALIKVTRKKDKVVYFLTRHGEKEWDNITELAGLGFFKQGLEQEAYTPKELNLAELTEVPDDSALLIIPGPQTRLFENEIAAIEEYLKYGGGLFLMEDPRTETGLESLLKDSYGVTLRNDIILDNDPISAVFGQTQLVLNIMAASYDSSHEATKGVQRIATVYSQARSLEKSPIMPTGVRATELVKTSNDAFGETDLDRLFGERMAQNDPNADAQGPLTLALAVEWDVAKRVSEATGESETGSDLETEKPREGRMLVVGDSDFISNQSYYQNRNFVMNCVNWLCQESDLISIRPKEDFGRPIFMNAQQGRVIFWVPVVILPLLVLMAGTMVYVNRRIKG
jgi:ABC-type uncharacterized transport system involved in gliding motility auxiliary subunit